MTTVRAPKYAFSRLELACFVASFSGFMTAGFLFESPTAQKTMFLGAVMVAAGLLVRAVRGRA